MQLLGQLLERLQGQRQRVQRQEPVQLLEPQQALGQPGQRLLFCRKRPEQQQR